MAVATASDLSKDTCENVVEFLEKVEQCGKWPQQACTTRFSSFPKNISSDRHIALVPTWIRWWEWLREAEEKRRQARYRVGWSATGVRNGGGERAWETLLEMKEIGSRSRRHGPVCDHAGTALV